MMKLRLYNDYFNFEKLRNLDINVETGVFGSDMTVNITNDGPVTTIIDSESDFNSFHFFYKSLKIFLFVK